MLEAKRILQDIRMERVELEALKRYRAEDVRGAYRPRSARADKERTGGRGKSDATGDAAEALIDLDGQIADQIAMLARHKAEALHIIKQIPDASCRTVLTLYYITGNARTSWGEVARAMHYSKRQVQTIHGRALLEMERRL